LGIKGDQKKRFNVRKFSSYFFFKESFIGEGCRDPRNPIKSPKVMSIFPVFLEATSQKNL